MAENSVEATPQIITRRKALKLTAGVIGGVIGTGALTVLGGREGSKPPPIEREGEVVKITKPEGQYVIMYGTHVDPRNPDKLPENLNAVVFENVNRGGFYREFNTYSIGMSWKERTERINKGLSVPEVVRDSSPAKTKATFDDLEHKNIEYSPIMSKIKEAGIPVIFADMAFKEFTGDVLPELNDLNYALSEVKKRLSEQVPLVVPIADKIRNVLSGIADTRQPFLGMSYSVLASVLEGAIGASLLTQIIRDKKSGITRRNFLSKVAKATAAAWLLMPSVELLLFITRGAQGDVLSHDVRKLVEKIHPETWFFLFTLRNVVLAHKEQWLMETMGNKPVVGTTIGSAHTGLEDQIMRSPEERLQFLRAVKPLLVRMFDPESIYKTVQFNFNGNEWVPSKVYEIPELLHNMFP